jgi:phosphoribosyl-AMP cyclohydrolase
MKDLTLLERIRWNTDGLIPCIIQEVTSQQVLMMAWMNQESLQKTLELGQTVFWSRSRQALWHKGETSGHIQVVKSVHIDCDGDVLLFQVEAHGAACHTNHTSCFFRTLTEFMESDEPYV